MYLLEVFNYKSSWSIPSASSEVGADSLSYLLPKSLTVRQYLSQRDCCGCMCDQVLLVCDDSTNDTKCCSLEPLTADRYTSHDTTGTQFLAAGVGASAEA